MGFQFVVAIYGGGYLGAWVARILPARVLRATVLSVAVAMTVVYIARTAS